MDQSQWLMEKHNVSKLSILVEVAPVAFAFQHVCNDMAIEKKMLPMEYVQTMILALAVIVVDMVVFKLSEIWVGQRWRLRASERFRIRNFLLTLDLKEIGLIFYALTV